MKNIIKLGLILFLITSLSAGILAFSNEKTKGTIAELAREASDQARKEVFEEASSFEEIGEETMSSIAEEDDRVLEVYEAKNDSGDTIGYTIKTATSGYGGDIQVVTGISKEGLVTGMSVGENQETPGLGTKAAEPEHRSQYNGLDIGSPIEVVKSAPSDNQIQALTGATITSEGVNEGVKLAVDIYNSQLSENAGENGGRDEEYRKTAFKEASSFREASHDDEDILDIHEALSDSGDLLGYVIKTEAEGYAGQVEVLTGILEDGNISGVIMGKNKETPGIGTEANCPELRESYEGKSVGKEFKMVKDPASEDEVAVVTGATYTAEAINEGVNKATEAYRRIFG